MTQYIITEAEKARLDNTFVYHAPFGDQTERYQRLRDLGHVFATAICECCPESREKSLAITKIEEAAFWANAAIARREAPPAAGEA